MNFRKDLEASPLAVSLLQALPLAVAVLDRDQRIQSLNGPAERLFGGPAAALAGSGPGDALHCLNALSQEEGCGHGPDCDNCLLRRAGLAAIRGVRVEQQEVKIAVRTERGEEERLILVSAAPLRVDAETLAVVLVQDVTFLHRLRGLIPICARCKKIRRDDQAWEALEEYLARHSHAEFTHGLCGECLDRLYPELRKNPDD